MTGSTVEILKVVSFTYTIIDSEGNLKERIDLPISYLHGSGRSNLFPQVEQALEGHGVGDVVEVTLTPEEGFGVSDPDLVFTEAIDNVPPEYRRLGAEAMFQNDAGETRTMVVTRIEGGRVTLDGNHPLAGLTITFKLTIKDIRDATPDEIRQGVPEGSPQLH